MASPLKINGVSLPAPKRGLEFMISTTVSAGRNANNEMVGERVGRDVLKANNVIWPKLTASEWATICNLMSDFYFTCSMPNPLKAGKWITHRCYCGDRSAEPYWIDANTGLPTIYINCKANIIDCGIVGD